MHLLCDGDRIVRVLEAATVPPGWWNGRRRRIATRFPAGIRRLPGEAGRWPSILTLAGWWGGYIAVDGAELFVTPLTTSKQAKRWVRGQSVGVRKVE